MTEPLSPQAQAAAAEIASRLLPAWPVVPTPDVGWTPLELRITPLEVRITPLE